MSILKDKSLENFQAIDLMESGKFFTPAIHCAYYSSLQLVIHYFHEYTGITENQAKVEISKTGSSHTYYVSKLVEEIKLLNEEYAVTFYKYFNVFKRKRTEADYQNIKISELDLNKAKEKATKIRKFLNKTFDDGKCENIHLI